MEDKNLIALMSRITELTNRILIDELKSHGLDGIVPSHGGILLRLFSGRRYTMQDMAAAIHRTKPTVTVLVGKLEAQGYVRREKSTEDSRVTYLKLTEKGKVLEPAFRDISDKINALVYAGVTEKDSQLLGFALRKILKRLADTREGV